MFNFRDNYWLVDGVRIRYICIRNFRSLRNIELLNLENLNIFVGKNSSGKSNLLEALKLFFDNFAAVGGNIAGLNEYYWFGKDISKPIEFEINIELSTKETEKIIPEPLQKSIKHYLPDSYGVLVIKRKITDTKGIWETTLLSFSGIELVKENTISNPNDLAKNLNAVVEKVTEGKSRIVEVPEISGKDSGEFLQGITNLIKGKFALITQIRDVNNPVAHRATVITSELQSSLWTLDQSTKLEDEEKYSDVDRLFMSVTGTELDLVQGQPFVRRRRRRFPLYLEGGGIQASIQLLFDLTKAGNSNHFLAIEEPEAHAHPELQKRLFKELKGISENSQMFITTHSPAFTDSENLEHVWITRIDNFETRFDRANELKEISRELGIRPSDFLFFADKILFVEGKSEEIVLPAFAQRIGINLNNIAIIPVEGKDKVRLNLRTWIKITRGLLPFFILLDKDAQDEISGLIKEYQIKINEYHVWDMGSIECYYPTPLLRKALDEINERFSLEMDVNSIMKQIEKGSLSPDKIDIGEKTKKLDKSLKVILAENIARLLKENTKVDIAKEMAQYLDAAVRIQ